MSAGLPRQLIAHDRLPDDVKSMLASRQPRLLAYSKFAPLWHAFSKPFVPRYGQYVQALLQRERLRPTSALDLACGTGHTSAELASDFAKVYALDISQAMLDQAGQLLSAESAIRFMRADFRSFSLPENVQIAVCAGDSLNYAAPGEDLSAVFRQVAEALQSNGFFVFDVVGLTGMELLGDEVVRIEWNGRYYYQYHTLDAKSGRMACCVVTPYGVEDHERWYISSDDVEQMAVSNGFELYDRCKTGIFGHCWRDFYVLRKTRS